MGLNIDRADIARFVDALFCRADRDTFVSIRAFFDAKDGAALFEEWRTVRVTGNNDDIVDAAEDLATLCAIDDEPICFAPPICTFRSRDKADVGSLANGLVITVELDNNPADGRQRLEAVLGVPTVTMESGGLWVDAATGESIPKLHLHWRLAGPTRNTVEHDFLREINGLATQVAGGDPSGAPLVHPLRWPGSWHRKAEPRLAHIITYNPTVEIAWPEALERLRAATKTKPNGHDRSDRATAAGALPQADLFDLCAALAVIPNDDSDPGSWDRWNNMGLRLYASTDGSDAGLALFLEWSRRSKKFDEAKTRERWRQYGSSPPDRTGAGAIFNLAKAAWARFVRPSEYARLAGLDISLAEFLNRQPPTPGIIEPDHPGGGTEPPRGNGHDHEEETGSVDPKVEAGGGGGSGGGERPWLDPPGSADPGEGDEEISGNGGELPPPGADPDDILGGEIPEGSEITDEVRAAIKRRTARILAWLQETYPIVCEAGKTIIVRWRRDPVLGRQVLDRITFTDFKRMYLNCFVQTVGKTLKDGKMETAILSRNLANWWLCHRDRRQHLDGITFRPYRKVPASYMNLWRGFVVEPKLGDWGLMKDHVLRVICRGDVDHFDYLLNLSARMFQEPHRQGEVATVVRGAKGAGKGTFLGPLVGAWGQHGLHITSAKHLIGQFNDHLRDCVALFADEAFFAGDKQHEGILKGLITETTIMIERKRFDAVPVANMLHIWMSSDSDWVVPASVDERRFYVLDAADNRVSNWDYFEDIAQQMKRGGLAAMIHELLNRNIAGFNFRKIPQTEALKTQKTLSLSSIERWWLEVLTRGFVWKSRHGAPWFTEWQDFFTTELLHRSYNQWCEANRPYDRKNRVQLGQFLSELYSWSRPAIEHPVFEIDSIDRSETRTIRDREGNVIQHGQELDDIAILYKATSRVIASSPSTQPARGFSTNTTSRWSRGGMTNDAAQGTQGA